MSDFNSILTLGEQGKYVNTVIEIPMGSMHKIEYNVNKKIFVLDRVEPSIFAKPVNYGFIPQTIDEDGDPLDTLVITDEPLPMGITLKAKVVALLDFTDDGEKDYKVICVPEDDRNAGNSITSIDDLNPRWKQKIEHHFNHYKDLKKPGSTKVEGWKDADEAWKIIGECVKRYQETSK